MHAQMLSHPRISLPYTCASLHNHYSDQGYQLSNHSVTNDFVEAITGTLPNIFTRS